jgi:hypothetical protein
LTIETTDYIALDLATTKLYVFVDGSFANNKDLSSQIGYELVLANETTQNEQFEITGNLIHWSSTKCKRVTRSVLASEIYGMTSGADMAIAIDSTIKQITEQLGLTPNSNHCVYGLVLTVRSSGQARHYQGKTLHDRRHGSPSILRTSGIARSTMDQWR